jgi:RHS repeat-associated protein
VAATVRYTVVSGQILAQTRSGSRHTYVPDAAGSTRSLIDQSAAITDSITYWPYGEVASRTGTTSLPFKFIGQAGYRQESNAIYVRARTFLASIGRWASVDPRWPSEPSYSYAGSNPASWIDPSGTQTCKLGKVSCYRTKEFGNCCTACGFCFDGDLECGPYAAIFPDGMQAFGCNNQTCCGKRFHCCFFDGVLHKTSCFVIQITDTGAGRPGRIFDLGCCFMNENKITNLGDYHCTELIGPPNVPSKRRCRKHGDCKGTKGTYCD